MAIVYLHIRNDTNEVFYVGIGNRKSRAYSKNARNQHWHNVVNKTDYSIFIVEDGIDWKTACMVEMELIKQYGRNDLNEGTLVNKTNGGEGALGLIHSDDTRKLMSLSQSGDKNPMHNPTVRARHSDIVKSEEYREKIKNACSGEKNGFYGKTHNEDTKNKLKEVAIKRHNNGTLPMPPIMFGSKNPSSKPIIAINHNDGNVYFIHGGIQKFCKHFNLSYHYYKIYCNKGKCKIIKSTHVRNNSKNTVDWEFRNIDISTAGGEWTRIKQIIQTELSGEDVTVVIFKG